MAIKAADEIEDPKQLLKVLKPVALTQGNLSKFDQWRVDLENPGEDARWTIALRAMIAQNSAGLAARARQPARDRAAALRNWLVDEALAGVRGGRALRALPATERASWSDFWREVHKHVPDAGTP